MNRITKAIKGSRRLVVLGYGCHWLRSGGGVFLIGDTGVLDMYIPFSLRVKTIRNESMKGQNSQFIQEESPSSHTMLTRLDGVA